MALDLAGGLGRHALWLAMRNWHVSVVDHSEVAIGKLRQASRAFNVKLDLFALDAAEYQFELARFDLIVMFYYLNWSLFPRIGSALRPGGLLLCKLHVQWGSEISSANTSENPLHKNELVSLVPELRVVHHLEREAGGRGIVEFVGRKRAGKS
jgi:SAM-dependent methyltransferase